MAHPLTDPNRKLLVAHRGARANAPENTIEALAKAIEIGVDALEFDVRLTRDGVPVLMHDRTVDRTTNGRGAVSDNTLGELRTLDASRGGAPWSGARVAIPTLEEVLDRFRGIPVIIDVKEPRAADPVIQMLYKFDRQGSAVVGSDSEVVSAKLYRSGIAACASASDCVALLAMSVVNIVPSAPGYGVLSITPNLAGIPIPTLRMTALARRMGIATHVWTVNDAAQAAELWKGGVTCVLSDNPAALLSARPK